jgi:hypothetical protein
MTAGDGRLALSVIEVTDQTTSHLNSDAEGALSPRWLAVGVG